METAQLAELLTAVQEGRLSVAEALAQWPDQAGQAPDFAVLDHGRAARTGMPEVVFCQGKTPEQVVAIVGRLLTNEGRALATRASVETAEAVLAAYPQARWQQAARVIALGDMPAPPMRRGRALRRGGHGRHQRHSRGRGGRAHAGVPRPQCSPRLRRGRGRHPPADEPAGCAAPGAGRHRGRGDGRRARQRARRAGRLSRGGRADQRGLRRQLRRAGRAAGHAELLRAGRGGGQHRQRVRRGGACAPDHADYPRRP